VIGYPRGQNGGVLLVGFFSHTIKPLSCPCSNENTIQCLGLLCLLGTVFHKESTNSSIGGYVAGHIAALLII